MTARDQELIDGRTFSQWLDEPWWPDELDADVDWQAGPDGHIVVTIDGYDEHDPIPEPIARLLGWVLSGWEIVHHTDRITVTPGGRDADPDGITAMHADLTGKALRRLGLIAYPLY